MGKAATCGLLILYMWLVHFVYEACAKSIDVVRLCRRRLFASLAHEGEPHVEGKEEYNSCNISDGGFLFISLKMIIFVANKRFAK